jgi:tetratricopeptide (TPR) repeat protein
MRWQLLIPKMEVLNSTARPPAPPGRWAAALLLLAGAGIVFASETNNPVFARRAEAAYQHAQAQFKSNPSDSAAAWQFARASFDLNDFITNNAGRADLAGQGIAACRQLLARESNSAPGHYYLAIELGQWADTQRNLAAFRTVREIEREFKTADDLDEHFDHAGPARCLGLLYRDAPGWPLSIGSRRKARDWLEQAAKLAPDFPENHLNLVETYWQWKDREAASNAWQQLEALWPAARTNFSGETWERSWHDWTDRRDAMRDKLNAGSTPGKSPKNSRN